MAGSLIDADSRDDVLVLEADRLSGIVGANDTSRMTADAAVVEHESKL